MTRKLQTLEGQTSPERLKELKTIASCIVNMGSIESSYFDLVHKENVGEREGLHPIALEIDSSFAGAKIGAEFAHPVNFFLQQEGMTKVWAKRAGFSVGGGSGGGAAQQAKVEEPKEAAPAEPEVHLSQPEKEL